MCMQYLLKSFGLTKLLKNWSCFFYFLDILVTLNCNKGISPGALERFSCSDPNPAFQQHAEQENKWITKPPIYFILFVCLFVLCHNQSAQGLLLVLWTHLWQTQDGHIGCKGSNPSALPTALFLKPPQSH